MYIKILILLSVIVSSTVSGWILAVRMRRRMQSALGRKVKTSELTSLTAWMDAGEQEDKNNRNQPITPK